MVRDGGQLPEEKPALVKGTLSVYAEDAAPTVVETLDRFLAQATPGDYVALMAYLSETPAIDQALQVIRLKLRDRLKLATTLGYGPRFLHSTGQFHKGGPNTGLFLQLTADDTEDAAVPGEPYSFGVLKRAQALGDLEALRKHGVTAPIDLLGACIVQNVENLAALVLLLIIVRISGQSRTLWAWCAVLILIVLINLFGVFGDYNQQESYVLPYVGASWSINPCRRYFLVMKPPTFSAILLPSGS